MPLRRRAALLAGLVTAVLAVCLGPAPGAAAAGGLTSVPCATGAISSASVSGSTVTLKGWITACAVQADPVTATDYFAVGWYDWAGGVHHGWIRHPRGYVLPADPRTTVRTDFSVAVDVTGYSPALCLAYFSDRRLDCVDVSRAAGVVKVTRVATTVGKVDVWLEHERPPGPSGPLFTTGPLSGTDPKCGTCW